MRFCNCFPVNEGLVPSRIVDEIAQGASSTRDIVEKTNAGNGCKTCRPRMAGANATIKEIAAERDASGAGWPNSDQFQRACDKLNKYALSH